MPLFKKRTSEGSTPEAFTLEALAVARDLPSVDHADVAGELTLSLVVHGVARPVQLHNLFEDLGQERPMRRRGTLVFALQGIAEAEAAPASFDVAAPHLMAALRNPSVVAAGGDGPVAQRPFLPFVVEVVALDQERTMGLLPEERFREWGVPIEQAHAVARENLHRHVPQVRRSRAVAGALELTSPDSYQASLLLDPARLTEVARASGGPAAGAAADGLLAFVPTRDDLLLVAATEPGPVEQALRWADRRYQESSRRLSPVPYVVRDDAVEPWRPAPGHPLAGAVRAAAHLLAEVEYGYQTTRLEDELADEDVFVASLIVAPDGFSIATWSEDVETLLPEADFLALVADEGWAMLVNWADASRLAGAHLSREPGLDPARWRVRGWPAPLVLEQLATVAEPA